MAFPIRIVLAAAATAFVTVAYAAEVPTFDVGPTCRPIGGDKSLQIDTDRCFKTEHEARAQLVREWADFPAPDRTLCTQTAATAGMPSYVALITCLEMKRDVAKLPADRGLRTRPSSMPAQQ
ncbi:MAG TPA: hypothetical protein VNQ14_13640 [Woeseiaceae bacterium]|nr:hypothetical protein [Woeseiaceae bacterium]